MNNSTHGIVLTLVACSLIAAAPAMAQPNVPVAIDHQGYIEVDGQPFDGSGDFRFALVNGSGDNAWTNDNTHVGTADMPDAAVSLPVEDGVYAVSLGDGNATDSFPSSFFANQSDLALRVWFDDGTNGPQRLTPDKPLRATPYARVADRASMAEETASVPNVITVDRVNYNTPRTKHMTVPAAAFQSGALSDAPGLFGHPTDPAATFGAPVYLPDGATVTELTVHWLDQDPNSDLQVTLSRIPVDGGTHVEESVDDSGDSGVFSTTIDIDNTSLTSIDGEAAGFIVQITDTADDWDQGFIYSVVIGYTISEAP